MVADRKLGDEWLDWDGKTTVESSEANCGLFLVLAIIAAVMLIVIAALFLWLIYPRLMQTGSFLPGLGSVLFLVFSSLLLLWIVAFTWTAATHRPIPRFLAIPRLINRLITIVTSIGKVFGISTDRLTNSFLKIHNVIIGSKPRRVDPEHLLILAPRCLTRENNKVLRQLRDQYGFQMATVGGGSEARMKIKEFRPQMIIAIACERDLLSGFREINPYIPVIGFPNQRPEGPCKNTCISIITIEDTVKRCIGSLSDQQA